MSQKFLTPIDMTGNPIHNLRPENLAALPSFGMGGRIVFNTTTVTLNFDTGTGWVQLGAAASVAWGDISGKPASFPTSLVNIGDMSAFARTLNDDADAAAARTTLGLGSAATQASGTFAPAAHSHTDADITDVSASKLTGTIDPARLPATVFQPVTVASADIASLTGPQQGTIVAGSRVLTSDGREWTYISGSKVLEASYQEMADRTPDWSAISNKPVTFNPSAHAHATSEVTGLDAALSARTRKAEATGPAASSTTWAVTHNLGTTAVIDALFDTTTGERVYADMIPTSANIVTYSFGSARAINSLRAVIIG